MAALLHALALRALGITPELLDNLDAHLATEAARV